MHVTTKPYNLEERTLAFAKSVIELVKKIPDSMTNTEISKQLIRAAGSVGANYIEANECLGKKDFLMRIKISRKEAKESRYWLKLIECNEQECEKRDRLIQESTELMNIFGSVFRKMQSK